MAAAGWAAAVAAATVSNSLPVQLLPLQQQHVAQCRECAMQPLHSGQHLLPRDPYHQWLLHQLCKLEGGQKPLTPFPAVHEQQTLEWLGSEGLAKAGAKAGADEAGSWGTKIQEGLRSLTMPQEGVIAVSLAAQLELMLALVLALSMLTAVKPGVKMPPSMK